MEKTATEEVRFDREADKALRDLYGKYGSDQTTEQKIHILEDILGKSHFYATGGDVPYEAKLACLEYEWLALKQLIQLDLA